MRRDETETVMIRLTRLSSIEPQPKKVVVVVVVIIVVVVVFGVDPKT